MNETRICWIHGWASNHLIWNTLPNEYGNGAPFFPSFLRAGRKNEFLCLLRESIGDEIIILVGWSMGAMLALEFAARYPEQIQKVCVINASLQFCHPSTQYGWPEQVVLAMRSRLMVDPEATVTAFIHRMFHSRTSVENRQERQTFINVCYAGGILASIDFRLEGLQAGLDYLLTTNLQDIMKNIQCPLLWLHGSDDTICPVSGVLNGFSTSLIRDRHSLHIIKKAGHAFPWTHSNVLKEHLDQFLKREY